MPFGGQPRKGFPDSAKVWNSCRQGAPLSHWWLRTAWPASSLICRSTHEPRSYQQSPRIGQRAAADRARNSPGIPWSEATRAAW